MSSILDALRKLEDEQRQIKEMRDFDPQEAAHELVGARTPRPVASPQPLNAQTLYLTLGAFAVGAVSLSVVVTMMLLGDRGGAGTAEQAPLQAAAPVLDVAPPLATAQPPTAPEPAPAVAPEPEQQGPDTPAPDASTPDRPETSTRKPVELEHQEPPVRPTQTASAKPTPTTIQREPVRAAPQSTAVETPARTPDVASRTAEPESAPLPSYEEIQERLRSIRERVTESPDRAWDTPPKVVESPLPEPTPQASPAPKTPVSSAQLPILSSAAKSRYGLDGLMVNILSPASPTKPQASAIISNMKYFVGERINDTRAKLVQVEPDGVVIEIVGTGEQYFLAQ